MGPPLPQRALFLTHTLLPQLHARARSRAAARQVGASLHAIVSSATLYFGSEISTHATVQHRRLAPSYLSLIPTRPTSRTGGVPSALLHPNKQRNQESTQTLRHSLSSHTLRACSASTRRLHKPTAALTHGCPLPSHDRSRFHSSRACEITARVHISRRSRSVRA